MCGRYSQHANPLEIAELFGCDVPGNVTPRYNVAPGTPMMIVRAPRQVTHVHWGLVPTWMKQWPTRPQINARAETIAEKTMFRNAFRRRRCLVPATGYYEWQAAGRGRGKTPFHLSPAEGSLIAYAGICEVWEGPEGEEVETSAIITTEASKDIAFIHDRMPVIIHPAEFERWLMTDERFFPSVQDLLVPAPEGTLRPIEVSTLVNNPRNDSPGCIAPVNMFDL